MNQATNAPPAPTVVIEGARYTTTATAAQLAAVFQQAGPWGNPAFDPTTTTWTLDGLSFWLVPALGYVGIHLNGPADIRASEDAGVRMAPVSADDDIRERLAALEHDRWSRWMTYLFSRGRFNAGGSWTMPAWAVARWQRQASTPYAALSDAEKDSDRAEAIRTLQVLELAKGVARIQEEAGSG